PAAGDGLWRQPADHAPGGGSYQGGLPGGTPAQLPALAAGAWQVAAVRLGGRSPGGGAPDPAVLRLASLVALSGGAADLGPQAGYPAGLPGRHPAPAGGRSYLPADGQRAHGDHRPGGGCAGAASGAGGGSPASWSGGPDLCGGGPRVEGRLGGHGEGGQGGPGADRGQPAPGVPELRGAVRGV